MTDAPPIKRQEAELRKSGVRLHILAIIVLGAIVFYLLDSATNEDVLDISRVLELSEQDYDYFMADVDSMHYTPEGRVDYRFRADRITHFPNPEVSLIDAPRFILFQDDQSAWRINAVNGRLDMDPEKNQERLVLVDDVIIDGITARGRPVRITTDALSLWPEDGNMHTDRDVVLESDGFITTSQGLFADINTKVFRQLANGQMQYEQREQSPQ